MKKRMYLKYVFATLVLFLLPCTIFSLEVDKPELESVSGQDIVFVNYNGPYAVINTKSQIQDIGKELGQAVKEHINETITVGDPTRYSLIHAINPNATTGLNADIFIIGKSAGVDHIKNVRTIIASYLVAAYDYEQKDAETLATFTTIYNAVYRNKAAEIAPRYNDTVTKYFTKDNFGLALNYQEWAGTTRIVIPISDISNGISTVDTSVISDKKVVESMRETDDKGIDVRKDMVELKEKEADKASEKAQEAQKEATEAKKEAEAIEQTRQQEVKELEEAKEELKELEEQAAADPENKELQEAVKEKYYDITVREVKVEELAEQAAEAQKKAEEASQKASSEQATADKKLAEAQSDRKDIVEDQKEVIANENAISQQTTYGLLLNNQQEMLSTIVLVDKDNGKSVRESPINLIRGRTIINTNSEFIAIAGKNEGNGAVRLVTIDKKSLEMTSQSQEPVAEQSVLVTNAGSYYVVIQDNDRWVIGKYNDKLNLLTKSELTVLPETPIIFTDGMVCVTDTNGILRLLDSNTLVEIYKPDMEK